MHAMHAVIYFLGRLSNKFRGGCGAEGDFVVRLTFRPFPFSQLKFTLRLRQ